MMSHVQQLSYYGFQSAISGDRALLTRVSAPINQRLELARLHGMASASGQR